MKRWIMALLVSAVSISVFAQEAEPVKEANLSEDTAELMFHGVSLFTAGSVSTITAEHRVEGIKLRLEEFAKSPLISSDNLGVYHDDDIHVSFIMHEKEMLLTVWETDAARYDMDREELANQLLVKVKGVIAQYRKDRTTESYIRAGILASISTVVFLVVWFLIRRIFKKEMKLIEDKCAGKQTFKLLDGDTIVTINNNIMKFIRALIVLTVFIVYLNIVLSLFPLTYNLSSLLFDLISSPIIMFGKALLSNLPNLFVLAVIVVITNYVLRGLKHMFEQIAEGKVRIKGFYQDWADTTYTLVRMVVIVFAAVVAFPYIPGSSSPAFKGISIFMGVLVSLGSTSAVGNIFGGLMLTYMRSFSPGDFVEINGMRGTVMGRRTFSTRMKTPTNEIISIPNASVSANHIINFSRMTKSIGVNIGTAVTIGYDVPWRQVHELLLKSAEGVADVLEDPAPTILQLALEDFYVKYKLVISTKNPAGKFRILSNIHQNIQDNFAAAGIEIMSPHFQGNREGEDVAIPDMTDVEI